MVSAYDSRNERRLFALRGAISVDENDAEAIRTATAELMRELMSRNNVAPDDMVSCIFTATADLDAEFPAAAAREIGLDQVPLLCAYEIAVPDAVPRVIRVLIHYYADTDHRQTHVYLKEARELRTDLHAAQ